MSAWVKECLGPISRFARGCGVTKSLMPGGRCKISSSEIGLVWLGAAMVGEEAGQEGERVLRERDIERWNRMEQAA